MGSSSRFPRYHLRPLRRFHHRHPYPFCRPFQTPFPLTIHRTAPYHPRALFERDSPVCLKVRSRLRGECSGGEAACLQLRRGGCSRSGA
jgi:hypothetical protein